MSGTERPSWEKARDEVADEMAGQSHYEWQDVQVAIDEMERRWRNTDTEAEQ